MGWSRKSTSGDTDLVGLIVLAVTVLVGVGAGLLIWGTQRPDYEFRLGDHQVQVKRYGTPASTDAQTSETVVRDRTDRFCRWAAGYLGRDVLEVYAALPAWVKFYPRPIQCRYIDARGVTNGRCNGWTPPGCPEVQVVVNEDLSTLDVTAYAHELTHCILGRLEGNEDPAHSCSIWSQVDSRKWQGGHPVARRQP